MAGYTFFFFFSILAAYKFPGAGIKSKPQHWILNPVGHHRTARHTHFTHHSIYSQGFSLAPMFNCRDLQHWREKPAKCCVFLITVLIIQEKEHPITCHLIKGFPNLALWVSKGQQLKQTHTHTQENHTHEMKSTFRSSTIQFLNEDEKFLSYLQHNVQKLPWPKRDNLWLFFYPGESSGLMWEPNSKT